MLQRNKRVPEAPYGTLLDPGGPVLVQRGMPVPVIVEELAGVPRTREPVTVGIPVAKGALRPESRLVLRRGAEALPTGATPLAWWSDGSLKWVLVDTILTVAARERLEEYLRGGRYTGS